MRANYFFKATTVLMVAVFAACVLVVVLAGVAAKPAEAAFPGENGKIAFVSDRTTGEGVDNPEGDSEIFTMDPGGASTNVTQLTKNAENDGEPAWSPDGKQLAFTRDGGVYVAVADGTGERRVVDGYDPAWSPDANNLAFVRDDSIYTTDQAGTYTRLVEGAHQLGRQTGPR